MRTDNLSFTSKNLIAGKAPEIKELHEMVFAKIAERQANQAKMKHPPAPLLIRSSDLTGDRFSFERKILLSTGDDIKEVEEIHTNRSVKQALGKDLPKYASEFKLPDIVLDAKHIINGVKNGTIDLIELLF